MKVWMPSIRTESGAAIFVHRLVAALSKYDVELDCQWFSKAYEFYPQLLGKMKPPLGTDLIFVNSWSAVGFIRHRQPLINITHHCVHDDAYEPYKSFLQKKYHQFFIRRFEEEGIKHSERLVAVSNYTAKTVSNIFDCPLPQVIYNSIDADKFCPKIQHKRNSVLKIVFIGNITKRKGFDLLPLIMQKLGNNFKLYLTSGLRDKKVIQGMTNIECVGYLSEIELINLYRSCDVMLFPTRYEGFGYSVAEAMSCGLPVVTTNCSSLPELVDHGKGGFLCPIDDVNELVKSVRKLAENPAMRREMGEYNRHKIESHFTLEQMANGYFSLFEDALSKRV